MEYITELEKEMAKMKAIQYENEKIFAKPPIPLPRSASKPVEKRQEMVIKIKQFKCKK